MSDSTRRRELLAAITTRPLDDAPRRIFADWLLDRRDPLGEFIHLDCACPTLARFSEERLGVARRRLEVLLAHAHAWGEEAYVAGATKMWWGRGFIERVEGSSLDGDGILERAPLAHELVFSDDPSAEPWCRLGELRTRLTRLTLPRGFIPEDLDGGELPELVDLAGRLTQDQLCQILQMSPRIARLEIHGESGVDGKMLGELLARRPLTHLRLIGRASTAHDVLERLRAEPHLVGLDVADVHQIEDVPAEIFGRVRELAVGDAAIARRALERAPNLERLRLAYMTLTELEGALPAKLRCISVDDAPPEQVEAFMKRGVRVVSPSRALLPTPFVDDDCDLIPLRSRVSLRAEELDSGLDVRRAGELVAGRGLSLATIDTGYGERWLWQIEPDTSLDATDVLHCVQTSSR